MKGKILHVQIWIFFVTCTARYILCVLYSVHYLFMNVLIFIIYVYRVFYGVNLPASLVAHMVKNLPAMQETRVRSLGQEDPWRRTWQPTPVFLPGESHGQRILVGYSPWGRKESDMTERLSSVTIFIKIYFLSFHSLSKFLIFQQFSFLNCQLYKAIYFLWLLTLKSYFPIPK